MEEMPYHVTYQFSWTSRKIFQKTATKSRISVLKKDVDVIAYA